MKEITRIHIAKYPYDIEVQAKKELESYIKNLEFYNDDENFLEDIEIRITEILAERDIEKNGLIASADVAALKEQLGEPKEIWGEGDIAVGPAPADAADRPRRRLYRDLDGAVLGGVLSGIARYFDVNSVWTRIIFLVILAASFGAAIIVYVLLWIIVPPARTAAEKLEAAGRSVTLASIKDLKENDANENHIAPVVQTSLRILFAAVLLFAALGALTATGIGGFGFSHREGWFSAPDVSFLPLSAPSSWVILGLFVAAGLLLASLLTLTAIALFKKKWTKRLTIATIIIVAGGVLTFGSGFGALSYSSWQQANQMQNSRTVANAALPGDFRNITNLTSDTTVTSLPESNLPVTVNYIVSSGTPHYQMTSANNSVNPVIHITGTTAILTVDAKNDVSDYYVQPALTIYGPALTNISVKSGSFEYYNKNAQDSLAVTTLSQQSTDGTENSNAVAGSFTLLGTYKNVAVNTDLASTVLLDQATVENLTLKLTSGYISAGVVRTLTATEPDVCPTTDANNGTLPRVVVRGVSSNTMTYNGLSQSATTKTTSCAVLIIGSETDYDQTHS